MNRWRPILQLLLARLREAYREPAVLFWVYGFPLFLAVGLGLAFSGSDPDRPRADLSAARAVDVQRTPDEAEARALQAYLQEHGIEAQLHDAETCRQRLRGGRSGLVVVLGSGEYEYHFDPDRPNSLVARYQVDDLVQRWKAGQYAWRTRDVVAREPGGRYIDYLIPGLMGLNLMGGGLWGVGFVIVDMRVRSLLKRLLATPMRRSDFMLSILGSRLVFIVPEMLVLALVGALGFGTPVRGSLITLTLVIVVGGAAFAGIGLLLACRTEKTETVSGLINLLMLPMWMLCGTFFSSSRFPEAVQPFIHVLPLTQLNEALRAVMLEGASLAGVAGPLAILAAWAVGAFLLARHWFRWL